MENEDAVVECEDAVVKPAGRKMVDMKGVKEGMWYEGQDAMLLWGS